jgi:hypothetical protein
MLVEWLFFPSSQMDAALFVCIWYAGVLMVFSAYFPVAAMYISSMTVCMLASNANILTINTHTHNQKSRQETLSKPQHTRQKQKLLTPF